MGSYPKVAIHFSGCLPAKAHLRNEYLVAVPVQQKQWDKTRTKDCYGEGEGHELHAPDWRCT